jgi:hypothetical protein
MRFSFLLHGVQIGFAVHPSLYPASTRVTFPGVKAEGE